MKAPINPDLRSPAGVAHNEAPLSPELRLPSPQRGRAAGERGAADSMSSKVQKGQWGLSARPRKLGTRILLACLWVFFFAESSSVLAQVTKPEKPTGPLTSTQPQGSSERRQHVQKVFSIKHAEVNAIGQTLRVFPVDVRENPKLGVVAISGPAALMPTIEDTIRRLDVPPPVPQNVELTVYLLLGSDQEGGSIVSELDGVVKQLKTTFAFKGFRAIDTLVVRSRDKQSADVKGLAKFDTDIPNPSAYAFGYRAATIRSDDKGRSIRVDGLRFSARVVVKIQSAAPSPYEAMDAGFGTDVDVREGQKIVVGKAAVGGTNTALILVITAKILE